MSYSIKVSIVLFLTAAQSFWLWMIARQHLPVLIVFIIASAIGVATLVSRKRRAPWKVIPLMLTGAGAGYVAAVLAVFVSDCSMRGVGCMERLSNLYFFPIASFAWLYGLAVFALLGRSARLGK